MLLQTLTAKIARMTTSGIFDGGSQRSFSIASAAQRLGCEPPQQEALTVSMFGGQHTRNT